MLVGARPAADGPVVPMSYTPDTTCGVAYRGRRVRDLTTKSVEEA